MGGAPDVGGVLMKQVTSLTLVLAAVLGALLAPGCTTTLTGSVVSATTGEPYAGAEIRIAEATAMTDSRGIFEVPGLARVETTGTVVVDGFAPHEFTVDLKNSNQVLAVEIPDCCVTVNVTETAVEPAEIGTMTVTLDGEEATGSPPAFFNLPPGIHILSVVSPDHDSHESTITLAAGESSVTVELSLTAVETYRRFLEAGKYHRVDVEYAYIHPDEQKLLTLEHWKENNEGFQMKSYALGETRMLDTWRSSWTKTVYASVAEIDRTIEWQVTDPQYSDYGQVLTDNFNQHWVKVDGVWRMVHPEKF